jgi:hypothetical protein
MTKLVTALVCLLSLTATSRADAFIEIGAFYFSEAASTGSSTSLNRTFLDGTVGFRIDKAGQYLVGWGVASHSQSDSSGSSTSYSSLQMGPRFLWMITRSKIWSLGFAYYIVTKATYNAGAGTGTETWKGVAYHFDAGYNLPITDNFLASLRLNYSLASYNEKLIGSTTYSTIGYSKSFIYPSIAAVYVF